MKKQKSMAKTKVEHSGNEDKAAILKEFYRITESIEQVDCPESCCEAIDHIIGLDEDDVLLCDVELLAYAAHALSIDNPPREVWLVPGGHWNEDIHPNDILDVCLWLDNVCDEIRENFNQQYPVFMGFISTAPKEEFKQVRHINEVSWRQPLNVLRDDVIWQAMTDVAGSRGALVSIHDRERKGSNSFMEGNVVLRGLSGVVEFDSGMLVLGFDDECEFCHMEDLSREGSSWTCDISPVGIAANEGCLVPSAYRQRALPVGQTTLGEIASRIGRGTSLTEKSLGPMTELITEKKSVATKHGIDFTLKATASADSVGSAEGSDDSAQIIALSKDGYLIHSGDLFYIDSSSFEDGKVIPSSLESIPKGQERYVVDKSDKEVLLVSRNGKQCAFYKAYCPTLIANSIFIVRFDESVDIDFLCCWMQSSFARAWLYDEGQMLAKATLASLPVPILEDRIKELVIKRNKDINAKIIALYNQITMLDQKERFAPITALEEYTEAADN